MSSFFKVGDEVMLKENGERFKVAHVYDGDTVDPRYSLRVGRSLIPKLYREEELRHVGFAQNARGPTVVVSDAFIKANEMMRVRKLRATYALNPIKRECQTWIRFVFIDGHVVDMVLQPEEYKLVARSVTAVLLEDDPAAVNPEQKE